ASLVTNVQRRVRRKDGIDVRTERDVAASEAGMRTEDVADIIDADVVQPNFSEALGEPGGASGFSKWRRRDARHFHLPLQQLRLIGAKPVKCGSYLGRGGKPRNFALQDLLRRSVGHCGAGLRRVRARRVGAHWNE